MPPNTLSAKQLKVIVLLANGESIDKTAKKAGCHEKTIDGWLKLPEFKQALRDAISEIYESAIAESVRHSTSAIKVLAEIVSNEETTNRDRIAAARELLANASKWRDWQLEERISKLEEIISESIRNQD
jgi:transposase